MTLLPFGAGRLEMASFGRPGSIIYLAWEDRRLSQLSCPHRLAARWVLALAAAISLPAGAIGEAAQPLAVVVVAHGSVPGIREADLNRFLADTMNGGVQGPWHFEPAPAAGTKSPNRIEWSIKSMTSAEGTVRSFGFARSAIDRMMGKHQILSIDATLFLGDQYQTVSHSEVPATKEAQNPDLAADVVRSTQQLMAHKAADPTRPLTPK